MRKKITGKSLLAIGVLLDLLAMPNCYATVMITTPTTINNGSYTDRVNTTGTNAIVNFTGNNSITIGGSNYSNATLLIDTMSKVTVEAGAVLNVISNHDIGNTASDSPESIRLRYSAQLINNGTINIVNNSTYDRQAHGYQSGLWALDSTGRHSTVISNGTLNVTFNHPVIATTSIDAVSAKGMVNMELNGPTNVNVLGAERSLHGVTSAGAIMDISSPALNVNMTGTSTTQTVNGMRAVYDNYNSSQDGTLTLKNGSVTNITISAPNATNTGILAQDQSMVDIQNGAKVTIKVLDGAHSYGLRLLKTGTNPGIAKLLADGDVDIDVAGIDSTGVYVANGGHMNLNGNVKIRADKYSLQADGSGTNPTYININQNGGKTVQIVGDAITTGPMAEINMKLDKSNSSFTGLALLGTNASGLPEGKIALDLSNQGTWNMTGSSKISSILMNDGIVDMTLNGSYKNLEAGDFTGTSGHIIMNTNLQDSKDLGNVYGESDRITISGASSGHYILDINDESVLSGNPAQGYLLLATDLAAPGKTADSLASFEGGNLRKGGIFKYKPVVVDVDPNPSEYSGAPTTGVLKNWYLAATENTGELIESVQPVLGSIESRYVNYQADMDTLIRRMGELRDNNGDAGIWVKYRKGDENISGSNIKSNKFQNVYVGFDKELKSKEQGEKRFWGLAFGHLWADQEYAQDSSGKSGMNSMMLYNTWLGSKGHYLDIVAKGGRMYNDFSYLTDNYWNRDESGNSSNWYYSLSAEYGRKLNFGKDGWYVEPQAQLTYGRINGSSFTTVQGTKAELNAINSLLGRTGFTLGKTSGYKDNESNVYFKLFWNKDFKGDITARLHDTYNDNFSLHNNLGSGWGTVGIGATSQWGKNADFYVDVEKYFGGKIGTNWMWNVGLRYNF